jgi:hypothetical protein
VPGSGEGQHTSNASILKRVIGCSRSGAPINASGCRDAIHSRCGVLAGTHGWCKRRSQVCPWWLQLGTELAPAAANQSW